VNDVTNGTATDVYSQIDLSPGGQICSDLMARADGEVSNGLILTSEGDQGALAPGLTPSMKTWLQHHVAGKRSAAIAEAQSLARSVPLGKGAAGFVDKVDLDHEKRHRATRRAEVLGAFRKKHPELTSDLENAEIEYGRMKADEGHRDAKVPSHLLEWGILLPAIMLPEGLLNFESFRKAPIIQSDFQALGATIITGIGIAVAAHLIGRFIRQFNFFMRADDDYQNRAGWPLWSIGSALLTVCLGVVGYARFYYLVPLRDMQLSLGQEPSPLLVQIGSLLLGNMVVFFIGMAITFLMHDPNPDFSDKARTLKKLKKKMSSLRHKEVDTQLTAVDRAYKENIEKVRRKAGPLNSMSQFAEVRRLVDKIQAKDQEVMAALSQYKEVLSSKLPEDYLFQTYYSSGDRSMGGEAVTLGDFKAMPADLLWG